MEKKEYRSAIRSRKMIRQAFFELLKEKNLKKYSKWHSKGNVKNITAPL